MSGYRGNGFYFQETGNNDVELFTAMISHQLLLHHITSRLQIRGGIHIIFFLFLLFSGEYFFLIFPQKNSLEVTHQVLLMSTHNKCFCGEICQQNLAEKWALYKKRNKFCRSCMWHNWLLCHTQTANFQISLCPCSVWSVSSFFVKIFYNIELLSATKTLIRLCRLIRAFITHSQLTVIHSYC